LAVPPVPPRLASAGGVGAAEVSTGATGVDAVTGPVVTGLVVTGPDVLTGDDVGATAGGATVAAERALLGPTGTFGYPSMSGLGMAKGPVIAC
jgi:hypothetical protein